MEKKEISVFVILTLVEEGEAATELEGEVHATLLSAEHVTVHLRTGDQRRLVGLPTSAPLHRQLQDCGGGYHGQRPQQKRHHALLADANLHRRQIRRFTRVLLIDLGTD